MSSERNERTPSWGRGKEGMRQESEEGLKNRVGEGEIGEVEWECELGFGRHMEAARGNRDGCDGV